MGNKQFCYPQTVTDNTTWLLFCFEGLESSQQDHAFNIFVRLFIEYCLTNSIRSDNDGVPFASTNALSGLISLTVWWLILDIGIERIKPGNPQHNGWHERMHLTLKQATSTSCPRNEETC
jgi:putative transposase